MIQRGRREGGVERALRGEGGFTLIETILSLSITVVILALLFSSFRLGYRSWERGERIIEEASTRRFLSENFSADVAAAYLYLQDINGQPAYIFKGSADEFGFVTANRSGGAVGRLGGPAFVRYSSVDEGLLVAEQRLPIIDRSDMESMGGLDSDSLYSSGGLEPSVRRVSFEYMGDGGWVRSWNIDFRKALPRSVRAEFFFTDSKRPLKVTVPIGIASGAAPDKDRAAGSKTKPGQGPGQGSGPGQGPGSTFGPDSEYGPEHELGVYEYFEGV